MRAARDGGVEMTMKRNYSDKGEKIYNQYWCQPHPGLHRDKQDRERQHFRSLMQGIAI